MFRSRLGSEGVFAIHPSLHHICSNNRSFQLLMSLRLTLLSGGPNAPSGAHGLRMICCSNERCRGNIEGSIHVRYLPRNRNISITLIIEFRYLCCRGEVEQQTVANGYVQIRTRYEHLTDVKCSASTSW